MTSKELIEKLKETIVLLEAQEQGKQLQTLIFKEGKWVNAGIEKAAVINLLQLGYEWRIKPEPRTWWVVFKVGDVYPSISFLDKENATKWAKERTAFDPPFNLEVRRVEEVLE